MFIKQETYPAENLDKRDSVKKIRKKILKKSTEKNDRVTINRKHICKNVFVSQLLKIFQNFHLVSDPFLNITPFMKEFYSV